MVLREPRTQYLFPLTVLLLIVASVSAADEGPRPAIGILPVLHLVWHDAYALFPSRGLSRMTAEIERLFARNGISVRVHVSESGDEFDDFPEPRINAVLSPGEGEGWGLPRNAMAAAIGEPGGAYTIFVFFPGVLRTLGLSSASVSPRALAMLSRTMGRVVAHELVHVLAPERGHARRGLMVKRLTRKALVAPDIRLDETSRRKIHVAVRRWLESGEHVAELDASGSAGGHVAADAGAMPRM